MPARSRYLAFFALVLPTVAFSQAGGPLAFHGTPVSPLGAATLTISPATGALVVGNIGASGLDGFELMTGKAQGVKVKFPWLPAEDGREVVARIQSDQPATQPYIVVTSVVGGVDIFVDFSSTGANGHLIEICNDGTPVAQTFIAIGDHLSCGGVPIAIDADMRAVPAIGVSPFVTEFEPAPMLMLTTAAPTAFQGPTGPIATGNELRAYPSNPLVATDEMEKLSILVNVPAAAAPYTMEFDDAAQLLHGRLHRGTMFGLLEKDFEGNINFSVPAGLAGGIQIDAKSSDTHQTITQNIKFANAGDTDAFYVTGERPDGMRVELARVTGVFNGSMWGVNIGFGNITTHPVLSELMDINGDGLADRLDPNGGGLVVASSVHPTVTAVDDRDGFALIFEYPWPVLVTLPSGDFPAVRIKLSSTEEDVHSFLVHITREISSVSGTMIEITGEPNGVLTADDGFYLSADGPGQYVRSVGACPCVEAVDLGLNPGASFTFEPVVQQDQFGIAWVPAASPAAGSTTAEHAARISSDISEIARMAIRLEYDGINVKLFSEPRQTPKTDFGNTIKTGMTTTAEFTHSDESIPFAILPAWPAAIGYQVLHYPDKTWSMWINLGEMMDIEIPGDPARGPAATQVVSGDFIQVTYLDTPITGSVVESKLVLRSYEKSHRLFYGNKPRATSVGPAPKWAGLTMRPPYPNPFNPSTTLSFDLPTAGDVSIRVYTVRGEYVATLHSGRMGAGPHAVNWDGINHRGERAASGVYLVELRALDGTRHTKMTLLK